MADELARDPRATVLNDVVLNQVLVRFGDDDDRTRQVVARVQDDGTAWLVRSLQQLGREPLDRMCDGLLGALGIRGDDDIALLAVRLPA